MSTSVLTVRTLILFFMMLIPFLFLTYLGKGHVFALLSLPPPHLKYKHTSGKVFLILSVRRGPWQT